MYRIGELAQIAGVSKRTIDYYTQVGLLEAERSKSNYRYYSDESLQRLKLIEMYKKEHMTLEEIGGRLKLFRDQPVSGEQVVKQVDRINEHLKKLEEEVLELKPLLEKLNDQQLKLITKEISVRGLAFIQTLLVMIGENPYI
ncbi:MAG: MerR family transcriptional regulator [Thermincolia bacterium]